MPLTIIRPNGSRLTLDAVIREDYRPGAVVTDHPVEAGSVVSDHVQRLPLSLSVEGLITESPYATSEIADPDDVLITSGPQRLRQALAFLDAAIGERLEVVSVRLGVFPDMALLAYPHAIDNRRRLPLSLEFRRIRMARAQGVQIAPTATRPEVQAGAPDEQDVGEQGTTTDTGPNRDRDRSLAIRGLQALGLVE